MKIRLINNLTDYLLASIICFPILQKKVEKNASECTRNHLTMPLSKCVLIIQLHELLIQIHHILMESPSPLSLWIFFLQYCKVHIHILRRSQKFQTISHFLWHYTITSEAILLVFNSPKKQTKFIQGFLSYPHPSSVDRFSENFF